MAAAVSSSHAESIGRILHLTAKGKKPLSQRDLHARVPAGVGGLDDSQLGFDATGTNLALPLGDRQQQYSRRVLLNVFKAGSLTAVIHGVAILPVFFQLKGVPMKRLIPTTIAIAALAGLTVAAEVAEAGKIRSPVERRLRPGRGFWQNGSSSQVRSYNSYSNGTRSYSTPTYSTPQQYYVMPQRQYQYSPYGYYYVQPPTYVRQPQTTVQEQAETSTPKRDDASGASETGE
jgi:hypothetical protein